MDTDLLFKYAQNVNGRKVHKDLEIDLNDQKHNLANQMAAVQRVICELSIEMEPAPIFQAGQYK